MKAEERAHKLLELDEALKKKFDRIPKDLEEKHTIYPVGPYMRRK